LLSNAAIKAAQANNIGGPCARLRHAKLRVLLRLAITTELH
jgi:hypothetical protein